MNYILVKKKATSQGIKCNLLKLNKKFQLKSSQNKMR